jgi:hypothetical protein
MKPVPQRIIGALQDDQRGDCYKCCVASILELPYEDVPHFAMGEPNPLYSMFSNVNLWLRENGIPLSVDGRYYLAKHVQWTADDIHSQYDYAPQPRNLHPGYWIAVVKSRVYSQSQHAIVMKDGEVAFDPSPSRDDPRPYEFCGEDVFVPDFAAIVRSAA